MADRRSNPTYYDGDLRSDLIDEALAVIREHGTAAVSLRALAKRLGVSHAAPANHFRTKRELFTEIARRGFLALGESMAMTARDAHTDDALELIERLGIGYLEFASENPGLFAVMFRPKLTDFEQIASLGNDTLDILQQVVAGAQRQGWRSGEDTTALTTMLWALVHGYAHLEAEGSPRVADRRQRQAVLRSALSTDPSVAAKGTSAR